MVGRRVVGRCPWRKRARRQNSMSTSRKTLTRRLSPQDAVLSAGRPIAVRRWRTARGARASTSARRAEVAAVDAPVVSFARSAMRPAHASNPPRRPSRRPNLLCDARVECARSVRARARVPDRAREFFALVGREEVRPHASTNKRREGASERLAGVLGDAARAVIPFRILV